MKKCDHEWYEDELIASGVVTLISGTPGDLGEETRVVCKKCGESRYVRIKDIGSLVDLVMENKDERIVN